jgi:hypothetical protein
MGRGGDGIRGICGEDEGGIGGEVRAIFTILHYFACMMYTVVYN